MQVTIQLDPHTGQQLQELTVHLDISRSEVLRRSIEALYTQHSKTEGAVLPHLAKHIGKYKWGDAHGSMSIKGELAEVLDAKFPR